jgi:hypothetical protein
MQEEINATEATLSLADYEKLLRDISKHILEKYPDAVQSVTDGKVEIKNLDQMEQFMADNDDNEVTKISKGRGGNNVAENMKKSVKSILKKELPNSLFQ